MLLYYKLSLWSKKYFLDGLIGHICFNKKDKQTYNLDIMKKKGNKIATVSIQKQIIGKFSAQVSAGQNNGYVTATTSGPSPDTLTTSSGIMF